MTEPRRIQLRRTAGWRKPEGAVVVARPGKWGNQYKIGDVTPDGIRIEDARIAVALYTAWLGNRPDMVRLAREQLAGRDLACWCPIGQPCHADVLLAAANGSTS